jgi:hypothetical protein
VISFSDLASDPRVDRQIAALLTRHEVVAAGLGPARHDVEEFIDISTPRRSAPGLAVGLARLLVRRYEDVIWKHPANVAVLERLRHVRADAVVANDLSALPIALRLGPPVAFDAHEYAPGQLEQRWWRLVMSPYMHWQCRRYIPQVASMTTVGEAIAAEYERETGVSATVVTNAPPRADLAPKPVHEPIRILHHGAALPRRGLEEMIRTADFLDERFTLSFVLAGGVAGYRDKLIRLASRNPRVLFPPPQPMDTLVRLANDYDIGLYALPPSSFNKRFALPNKLFEFVQGRLAVAVGPSPEMARLVRRYGLGIVADDFAPETLAAAINALDASSIAAFKRASHAAADELCAEANVELVLGAVEEALEA